MFDQRHQQMGLLAPDGTRVQANRELLRFAGGEPGQIVGRSLWDASGWREDPARAARLRDGVRRAGAGEVVRFDLEVEGARGPAVLDFSIKPVRDELTGREGLRVVLAASPIRDEAAEVIGVCGIYTDISELVGRSLALERANEALAERAKELRRSNAELEQFAYVASDLQEPLRAVGGFAQLLARRYRGRLDADADEFIDFIVDGAQRMQALINDLLTYSRAGRAKLDFARVDLDEVIDRAEANLREVIREAGAEIARPRPLPAAYGNAGQLVQLFQNLLGNAAKFCKRRPRVEIRTYHREGHRVIALQDNGIGIDPAYGERVFVLFQRLHTREEYPGTGIGLALCKKIAERHGGWIWFESKPDEGSTFYVTLPDRPPSRLSGHESGDATAGRGAAAAGAPAPHGSSEEEPKP